MPVVPPLGVIFSLPRSFLAGCPCGFGQSPLSPGFYTPRPQEYLIMIGLPSKGGAKFAYVC